MRVMPGRLLRIRAGKVGLPSWIGRALTLGRSSGWVDGAPRVRSAAQSSVRSWTSPSLS